MKTSVLLFQCLLIISLLSSACNPTNAPNSDEEEVIFEDCNDRFVPFIPISITENGNRKYKDPDLLKDTLFLNRLSLTLAYYRVLFFQEERFQEQKVYVDPVIASDHEFVYNMTWKAQDTNWLKTHVGPCCY